jgi:hypothetical protein
LLGGEFNMSMTANSVQPIIDHAKKHLGLSEKDIVIMETPISQLPDHLDVYYVEKKKSHGNLYFHYVISGGDLFCSEEKDSFERLLKKERYLEQKNLNVDQLIVLFSMLKAKIRNMEVIQAEDLSAGGIFEQYSNKIAAPAIIESPQGVKVVFWTTAIKLPEPKKWEFVIKPDYNVDYWQEA